MQIGVTTRVRSKSYNKLTHGGRSVALLVYDYLLTFGREVELYWKMKPTGASVLFAFNRYLTIVYAVSVGVAALSAFEWTNTVYSVGY